jgi:hypothetical protein
MARLVLYDRFFNNKLAGFHGWQTAQAYEAKKDLLEQLKPYAKENGMSPQQLLHALSAIQAKEPFQQVDHTSPSKGKYLHCLGEVPKDVYITTPTGIAFVGSIQPQ